MSSKTHRGYLRRHVVLAYPGRYILLRLGIGFSHALPGGHACLRDQVSWRTVNGLWINTRWGIAWLLFRRAA